VEPRTQETKGLSENSIGGGGKAGAQGSHHRLEKGGKSPLPEKKVSERGRRWEDSGAGQFGEKASELKLLLAD